MYYSITPQQANTLGEFTFNGFNFCPFVREQVNGNFLVGIETYNLLKDTDKFKLIEWPNLIENTNDKFTKLLQK